MDVCDIPIYATAMAGRLTGLSACRVRRWLRGYDYSYKAGSSHEVRTGHKDPLITRYQTQETKALPGGFHFAQRSFFTDGRNIYLQVRNNAEALLELLSGGQWVIAPIINELSHKIDFDMPTGLA